MRKNKLITLGLVLAISSAIFTGCGSSSAATDSVQTSNESNESGETNAENESNESADSSGEQTTWQKIQEQRYITFATEGTYSPYSYHDDEDNLVGYDVEVAQAVADKLGVEAKFTETQWDGIVAGLDAKKYDVIANQVSITEEREEKYLFSTPYTYAYGVVIVSDDNSDITSFEDLDGKQVSLTTTSNWAALAESYGGTIVATNGFSESIQLVLQGRADATVNDNVTYLDYMSQQPDSGAKIAATSDEATESAMLIRKTDTDLQEAIDNAFSELKEEGKISEISKKYFGEDISEAK